MLNQTELVKKEEKYHEINSILDEQRNDILRDIENMRLARTHARQNARKPTNPSTDIIDEYIHEITTNQRTQPLIRMMKTKLQKMDERVMDYHKELKKKTEIINALKKDNKTLEMTHAKVKQHYLQTREALTKAQTSMALIKGQMKVRESENNKLKKDAEQVRKDLRAANGQFNTTEKKLNRALEEVERLRTIVDQSKTSNKDTQETVLRTVADLEATIRRIEKQKGTLAQAYKKQMLLIDNLKRQKVQLEITKVLEVTDEDLVKLLNWEDGVNV